MPRIIQPRTAPEFVNGKVNQVTGIVPAQLFAVSWVDGNGQKSNALVCQFGHDNEDNAPGVFIMASEEEMEQQLKIANSTIKKGVRAYLARQANPTAEEIPETATTMVAAPTKKGVSGKVVKPAQQEAVKPIDLGGMDGPPSVGNIDISKVEIG
jgi:hypothetical protein